MQEGGEREWWVTEPLSAVLRRPRTRQGGHGLARRLGGRVLAMSGARRGWFGMVRGAARLKTSARCRKGFGKAAESGVLDAQRERGPGTVRGRRTRINLGDVTGHKDYGLSGRAAWECKEGGDARHARRRSGREGRRLLTL